MLQNTKQIEQWNEIKLYDLYDVLSSTNRICQRSWKLTFDLSKFKLQKRLPKEKPIFFYRNQQVRCNKTLNKGFQYSCTF